MTKTTRARCTREVRQEAVPLVEVGQSQASVAKTLGLAEQMEIARLRAELARVRMECDIPGKATAYCAKSAR